MPQVANQNIIALVWDFDKTLIPNYMQTPLFEKYGIDQESFWKENNELKTLYRQMGIKINPDTIYLNHLLTYVQEGICKGLNNSVLRELGAQLHFFPGLPDIFESLKEVVQVNPDFERFDIKVEHYVVSTGLTEMIKGSAISPYVDGIWGCEFIESPFIPSTSGLVSKAQDPVELSTIAYTIDNTTKTRALFEINKGVNQHEEVDVNQRMDDPERRVPFQQMIYIADGPSDVPAFSVVKKGGGKAYAVYDPSSEKSFGQVDRLREDGRVDSYGPADYRKGSQSYMWLTMHVKKMAEAIVQHKKAQLLRGKDGIPTHIVEE